MSFRLIKFIVMVLLSGVGLVSGAAVAQAACQEIHFAPGASSGTIEGEIPPDGEVCFTIEVGEGQRAEASIEGPEAQFPIIMINGLTGDGGEQSVSWRTKAGTYQMRVRTLFSYGANTPFRLRVSVTGG